MSFNFDMTLGELLENEKAVAVLTKYLDPELINHPMLSQIKHMTVNQLRPHAEGMVPDEMFEQIEKDLNELE